MGSRANRHLLAAQYPLAFVPAGGGWRKKVLKHGIVADLVQRGVLGDDGYPLAREQIEAAVMDYKAGAKFCWALARGGFRYDLDGKPCGHVSRRLMEQAAARIERMGWQRQDGSKEMAA